MKAIFVTENEAREFINNNFGKDAILKDCEVSDSERFDIDEVPYQWGGSTFAYEVSNGEAYVGFMEEPGAVYSAVFFVSPNWLLASMRRARLQTA